MIRAKKIRVPKPDKWLFSKNLKSSHRPNPNVEQQYNKITNERCATPIRLNLNNSSPFFTQKLLLFENFRKPVLDENSKSILLAIGRWLRGDFQSNGNFLKIRNADEARREKNRKFGARRGIVCWLEEGVVKSDEERYYNPIWGIMECVQLIGDL